MSYNQSRPALEEESAETVSRGHQYPGARLSGSTARERMSIHIDQSSRLINSQEKTLALTCPHCQVVAHVSVSAVPRFEDLQTYRPAQIGIVYHCDACHAPIFLRFSVRMYAASRLELSPQFIEIERAREKCSFTCLPEEVELLFKETLTCFSSGAFNAFASMCRRTAQAVFADLGEAGKLRLFD